MQSSLQVLTLLMLLCPAPVKGAFPLPVDGLHPNFTVFADNCPYELVLLDIENYTYIDANMTRLRVQGVDVDFDVVFYILGLPVVCAYIIGNAVSIPFLKGVYVTTLVVTSLAIVSSVALLVTYSLFKQLRTLPGQVIMNLAAAFLLGDISVLVRTSLESNERWFFILESYFFYARFAWMALVGFEISRHIYNGLKLKRYSEAFKRKLLIVHVLCGWSIPLVPVVIMAAVEYTDAEKENGTRLFGIGGYVITLVPISILLLFNVGIVMFLIIVLCKASAQKTKLRHHVRNDTINFSRVFLIVLTVLGLSWFSVFVITIQPMPQEETLIAFIILNGLQPVFVGIAFLGTKKILDKYLIFLGCKEKPMEVEVVSNPGRAGKLKIRRILSFILFSDRSFGDFPIRNSMKLIRQESGCSKDAKSIHTPFPSMENCSTKNCITLDTINESTMLEIIFLQETSV